MPVVFRQSVDWNCGETKQNNERLGNRISETSTELPTQTMVSKRTKTHGHRKTEVTRKLANWLLSETQVLRLCSESTTEAASIYLVHLSMLPSRLSK